MHSLPAKPELMKRMNTTLLYRALISMQTATRAELVEETQISVTTVRALLEELTAKGEMIETQLDQSSGGRRAQRYALNPQKHAILSFYLEESALPYRVCSLTGACLEEGFFMIDKSRTETAVASFLSQITAKHPISAVGVGVPGIVENSRYLTNLDSNSWKISDMGKQIQAVCQRPFILENDLNAAALGFCLRYGKQEPAHSFEQMNMVYIHFNKACAGAGIIADGRVVHGARQFAGELGFLPMPGGGTLNSVLMDAPTEDAFLDAVAYVIGILCCVTNPAMVVVGGDWFAEKPVDLPALSLHLKKYIADLMLPEIVSSRHFQEDYLAGLHHLTVEALVPRLPLSF